MGRKSRAVCAGVLAVASVAGAQVSTPTLDQLLARLRSDSFAERDAATTALVEGTNFDTTDLVRALNSGTLDAESTQRLTEVLRQRFFTSTRAAIGIEFQPGRADDANPVGAPRVTRVVASLPAGRAGLLRIGDEIIEVEGESLENRVHPAGTRRLQSAVFSRLPGESIRVKIRRPAAPPHVDGAGNLASDPAGASTIIEAVLPLGRFDQLASADRDPEPAQLERPAVPNPEAPPEAPRGLRDLPVVIVEPNLRPGQINDKRAFLAPLEARSSPLPDQLADAWLAFARRSGITHDGNRLTAPNPEAAGWNDAGDGVAAGRPILRGGGRVLAGPIITGRGFASLLRDQADIERNQLIRQALAQQAVGQPVRVEEPARNQNPQIVHFGDGPNRVQFRVMANPDPNNPRSRNRTRMIPEEQFQAMCAVMADEIAAVEADLRRLAADRARAGDDLTTHQILDERIAELRDRWNRLRAEAADFSASPAPAEVGVPSSFR
jgi:hypothetical protein